MITREAAVQLARSWARLPLMGGPNDQQYLDVIAPWKIESAPGKRRGMGLASGCGLLVRGYLRILGCDAPSLFVPYVDRQVITELVGIAGRENARKDFPPEPGDVLYIGSPEHVEIVTLVLPSEGLWEVEAVGGGQGEGGRYVDRYGRTYTQDETGHWISDRFGQAPRPLLQVWDLEALVG